MKAIRKLAGAPVRDQLITIVEGFVENISDCCDPRHQHQARMDELETVDRKLWEARTDTEAIAIVAGLNEPAVTGVLRSQNPI